MNSNVAPPVVLVADDEPTMLELVARHLRSVETPKMEVIEASDGDEAWRLARERLPDLVVLDVMMPGMSGWEVCRKIRQDAALAHTGVLMLTGIGESLNEATSPLFGADEYIDKPFEFEKLDEKIVNVLTRRAAQREAVPRPRSEAEGASADDASVEEPSTDDEPPAMGADRDARPVRKTGARRAARRAPARPRRGQPSARAPSRRATQARTKPKAPGPSDGAKRRRSKTKQEKGMRSMAAKKGAKKAAKKVAKKTATKAPKKMAKKTAKKSKK